jgi:hypothetical protein
MRADVLDHCRDAVAKLDYLLRNHPAETAEELTDAVRCVVALRDNMIDRNRARRQRSDEQDRRLRQVNSIISAIVAGEFPLMGIRWQRIEGARDLLKQVLAEEESVPE